MPLALGVGVGADEARPGAKQAGSNPLKPTGSTPRADATAITSRASRSNTANRRGSAKFTVIESSVRAVANSMAP